jgi:hypothetical protein
MTPGAVPRTRRNYAKPLALLGVACAGCGLLAFFANFETRLGYAWSGYPLKFSLADAANFLNGIGFFVAVGVPIGVILGCVSAVMKARDGRASLVGGCIVLLILWLALSGGMFFVDLVTHMYSGKVGPDGGLVVPALLIPLGYVLIGASFVIRSFQETDGLPVESANHSVNRSPP